MDAWNLDEESLSKWQTLQHCTSTMLNFFYNEWKIMLGLHFSVDYTTWVVYN